MYLGNDSVHIGTVYRPPESPLNHLHILSTFIHEQSLSSSNLIILGDFNLPGIGWSSLTVSGHKSWICRELVNLSLSCNLKQIVNSNTRGTSLLDLVFLSEYLSEIGYKCEIIVGISDHKAVCVSVHINVPKRSFIYCTFHDFAQADDASLINY